MKVLLICPPFYRILGFYNRYFPLGITIIGTVLKKAGHEVTVYDADYNDKPQNIDYAQLPEKYPAYLASFENACDPVWSEVKETVARCRPDIVGITVFTTFAAAAFHTARIVKELFPSCPVVMGGPHASVKAGEILGISPHVDYVVRGEGEAVMMELLHFIENGGPSPDGIAGLSYRVGGHVRDNPPRERLKDLDSIPYPERSLLLNEKKYSSEDMGLIMTSRGCPYSCSYCSTDTRRVGYRSIDNVMEEVLFVNKTYGTTQFTFKDDSFTVSRKRVEELCARLIEAEVRVKWECNTRINLVDEGLLRLMKKAGCNFIKVGIESGSDKILESMNKGITLGQIRTAARLLEKTGIHWTGYFLMGVPGETPADIRQTLALMYEIKPDLALIGIYEPFPGTPMFEDGIRRGLIKPSMTLGDFFTTLPNHYYKADPCRQVDTMGEEEFTLLEKEMKDAFHRYNKRPVHVMAMAKAKIMVYIKEPDILYEDIRKYLRYIVLK